MSLLIRKKLNAPVANGLLLDYLAQPGVAPVQSDYPVVTLGITTLVVDLTDAGIASGEAFGSPDVAVSIGLTGIASAEAVGTPTIGVQIKMSGIPSAEAVGTPTIGVQIKMSGIPSAEVFGSLTVTVTAISDNAKNRGGREIRRDDWERKMERDRQEYDERERMYLMQDETDIMAIITKFLEVVE